MLDRPSAAAWPLGEAALPVAMPLRQAVLTPGITRPQAALIVDDNLRVAGRVHADVRPPLSAGMKLPRSQPGALRRL